MGSIKNSLQQPHETLKYLVVGGLNAVFTCLIFSIALYWLKLHYLLALTIAWILGNIFTYCLNYVWVFKPEKQFRFNIRFLKYTFSNVLSFAANGLLLAYLVSKLHWSPFYLQLLLMPILIAANFLLAKFWSMKRLAYG